MRSPCFIHMPFTQMRESSTVNAERLVQMREPRRGVVS
jgi:hypothetical protein